LVLVYYQFQANANRSFANKIARDTDAAEAANKIAEVPIKIARYAAIATAKMTISVGVGKIEM
jgi:hypothetical protein